MNRLYYELQKPRTSILASFISIRAAGFIISFAIARILGISALGSYSALLNTTALVVSPFVGIFQNNGALLGARALTSRSGEFAQLTYAATIAALGFSLSSIAGYILLSHFFLLGQQHTNLSQTILIAGVASVVGQVSGANLSGLLQGSGRHKVFAISFGISSLCAILLSAPILMIFGIIGAYYLVAIFSLLPTISSIVFIAREKSKINSGGLGILRNVQDVFRQLLRSSPSAAAALSSAAVYWACGTMLMEKWHGPEGVALGSVAIQWYALMLLPVTSWGGLSIKSLHEALIQRDRKSLNTAIRRNVAINMSVTFLLASSILVFSGKIAISYHLEEALFKQFILTLTCNSLITAIGSVSERLLLCINAQWVWWCASLSGAGAQLLFCIFFLKNHIVAWPLGFLLGNLVVVIISCAALQWFLLTKERTIPFDSVG